MYGLTPKEYQFLKRLNTPNKIQDYLDTLPINYEKSGETYHSPRFVLQHKKAHCLEGALLAAVALMIQGHKPLLLDLRTTSRDTDHVVALFKVNGYWGAISKTNHAVLRFRDPVYKTLRELVLSYFHEYFLSENGKKTLREYSAPFNLKTIGIDWITSDKNLQEIANALDDARHYPIAPKSALKLLRNASDIEIRAGKLTEWSRKDRRT